eukprot:scaffold32324_cov71-Phaeocystis_antarctica.AAC.1
MSELRLPALRLLTPSAVLAHSFHMATHVPVYGGSSRGTHLLEDQLGRADAGSWQIADRYYMAS